MKLKPLIASLAAVFALGSCPAWAAVDSNYYVADAVVKRKFEVYNDGRNTYIQAITGLVVKGATADGEKYIIRGVPTEIVASFNGRNILITRGVPPVEIPEPKKADSANSDIHARIAQLSSQITKLTGEDPAQGSVDRATEKKPQTEFVQEKSKPVWVVKPGASLRAVLAEFTARAGWYLDMNYKNPMTQRDEDLTLGGGIRCECDFKAAIRKVFESLPAKANVRAELIPDNDPPTLYVYRKGMN